MTIEDALLFTDIDRLEAELLLCHALCVNRTWLMVHSTEELDASDQKKFTDFVQRREKGEPIAYIIESKEFYGREYVVHSSVLIPRPATESLVDEVIRFANDFEGRVIEADTEVAVVSKKLQSKPKKVSTIVDIGTGSGCIAITLALELPDYAYIATDISTDALEVAKQNAEKHEVKTIEFREGNMMEPIADLTKPFLLVSNPPYIPKGEKLMKDVSDFEPHTALFGGKDGADYVRTLVEQAKKHPHCQGIIVECKEDHAALVEELSS